MNTYKIPAGLRDLSPGDHVCFIYETDEEHRTLLTSFIMDGLERNERVLYIVDTSTAENIILWLGKASVDAEPLLDSGQLLVLDQDEACAKSGVFDPAVMIGFFEDMAEKAREDGFSALRITGEMTWALRGLPGSDRLFEYENMLNDFFAGNRALAMCQYDMRRFSSAILLDALRTHPLAFIGTALYQNPYYISPAERKGGGRDDVTLRNWINNLKSRRQVQQTSIHRDIEYRLLFDSSDEAIMVLDADTLKFEQVNDAALKLYGYTKEEFLKLAPADLSAEPEKTSAALKEIETAGSVKVTERIQRRKDGTSFPVEIFGVTYNLGDRKYIAGFISDLSERKEAEEKIRKSELGHRRLAGELKESERELELTLSATTEGIWKWNFITDELYFSPGYYRMLGYEPGDFSAAFETWLDMIHPDDRERALNTATEYLRDKPGSYENHFRLRTKSGEYRHIVASGKVVERDRNGNAVRMIGNHMDVTDRKIAEEALMESEKKYRSLFDNANDIIIYTDNEGGIVDINNRLEDIVGLRKQDVIGKKFYEIDLFSPGELQKSMQLLQAANEGGGPPVAEVTVRNTDGKDVLLEARPQLIYKDGALKGISTILRDITERKRAEEMLRRSEEDYRTIFESANDALVIHDLENGSILHVNQKMCEMYGYTEDEAKRIDIGAVSEGKAPYSLDEAMIKIRKAIEGSPQVFEWRAKKKSGEVFWVEVNLKRIRIGENDRLLSIVRDIEERKNSEAEKEKLNRQLLQAQKMEAVGQLAGGMAHDFNNMLGVIMGYGFMLLDDMDNNDEKRGYVEEILTAAKRSKELTSKLLTFSRKDKLNVKATGMDSVIGHVSSILERTLHRKIEIMKNIEPGMEVEIDQNQIHQALLNICNNSRDAMPRGGALTIEAKRIRLEAARCSMCNAELEGEFCLLQVSDTGIGMTKDIQEKIFDPFFTTKGVGKGTGLGLSTSLGIIHSHGGHISVYSEPGRGTDMKIYLPLADCTATAADRPPDDTAVMRGNETALVVDDEKVILDMAANMLSSAGYQVITAEGGREAINKYRERQEDIDVVVLDIVMPDIDGEDVLEAIKSINPDAEIVISSGYSINGQAGTLMDKGANSFVQKPFTPHELTAAIRSVLDAGAHDN